MLSVIGIGNRLRGDDGIGPKVIELLVDQELSIPAKILDAGADAFTILNELLESNQVLLIDCAHMGLKPGKVKVFSIDSVDSLKSQTGVSLHGFSIAEVWKIAVAMGVRCQLTIIGVEPEQTEFNSGLSDEVEKSIPTVLRIVREEAVKYAEKNSHH